MLESLLSGAVQLGALCCAASEQRLQSCSLLVAGHGAQVRQCLLWWSSAGFQSLACVRSDVSITCSTAVTHEGNE